MLAVITYWQSQERADVLDPQVGPSDAAKWPPPSLTSCCLLKECHDTPIDLFRAFEMQEVASAGQNDFFHTRSEKRVHHCKRFQASRAVFGPVHGKGGDRRRGCADAFLQCL